MGEPIALDLVIAAERKTAMLRARVRIGGLGRNAPQIAPLRSVDDDAPVERPSTLRFVEQNVGAPGRIPVGSGELLHGGRAPLMGVAPVGVPTARQAYIAEDRSPQAGEPFEPHPELSHGSPPACAIEHRIFTREILQYYYLCE